jgi:hypothetical protein
MTTDQLNELKTVAAQLHVAKLDPATATVALLFRIDQKLDRLLAAAEASPPSTTKGPKR